MLVSSIPTALFPIATAIRNHMTASGTQNLKAKESLDNLNQFAEVLTSDTSLARLIRDGSSPSTSNIWTHQFSKEEMQFPITIALSTDAVVTEIQVLQLSYQRCDRFKVHCLHNHRVGNCNSQFPVFIKIETGTSLSRLISSGTYTCNSNPNQPNARYLGILWSLTCSNCYTSCFKFKIGSEVVRYVRLQLQVICHFIFNRENSALKNLQ